jgi:hypothetical protein
MSVDAPPKRFRATISRNPAGPKVEREGGMFDAGLIRDVSLITVGEALGHEMWCDAQFIETVALAVNQSPRGIKARFTHPGLSSDGVGTKLGKFDNARVVGDQVIADMHFQKAASKTPDGGDLADYVMTLAEETPEDFGLSIVFDHDYEASDDFSSTWEEGKSPDEDNEYNYMHARLWKLYAADVVDSPAANPSGLFKAGQEAAIEADGLLSYALGISDVKPSQSLFNVDSDRAKQFFARFLSRHGLSLVNEEVAEMSEEITPVEAPEVQAPEGLTREDFNAELGRYVEAFGSERGTDWFLNGVEFAAAQALCIEALSAELSEARDQIAELNEKIESIALGEEDSGVATPEVLEAESEVRGFAGKINIK